MDGIEALSDAEILAGARRLRARERVNTAALIAHLVEVEGRELFAEAGYSSMFKYLMGALGYPEDAAAKRARVARLVRRLPVVLEHLANGRLHLSGAVVLAPHLTPGNANALLRSGTGRSKRELEQLVADLAPRPAPATHVRRLFREAAPLPAPSLALDPIDQTNPPRGGSATVSSDREPTTLSAPPPEYPPRGGYSTVASVREPTPPNTPPRASDGEHPPRGGSSTACERTASPTPTDDDAAVGQPEPGTMASVHGLATATSTPRRLPTKTQPLGRDCYRVAFNASASTLGKIDRLVALMSHQVPDGDLGACLDRALDVAIGALERERFGSPSGRRAPKPDGTTTPHDSMPRTRHVPAATRRAVFERDGGRCAYVAPDGRRCSEVRWLEIDHAGVPFALGGSHEVDNLALFCRAHNQWAGRKVFGEPPSSPVNSHHPP